VARDDPDALIAAALLLSADDSRRIPSLRRAAILAPESARIQAMAMRICAISQPCDTARYEMALRKIAPDNALGWITEVVRSSRMDDKDALARALTSMSHARTYDTYDSSSSLSMISQIRSARVPPPVTSEYFPSKSAYMALDSVATIGTTDYRVLYKVCKSAPDEKTLLECRRIGAAMQAGDSIDHNLAGLTIGGYGLPPNSDEARALAREVVRIKWIIHQLGQLPGMPLDESGAASDQLMEELQGVMAAHPREIDAERALLQEHGLPTEPPADWQPSN
jgi:hypothetical protein